MSPAEQKPNSASTGARTAEGKARSSMNAMRHGLTGRVVVLPSEDLNVYRAFCQDLMAELAPQTALERQYAQTFCDTQWRLNRARSYEDSMLALGYFEHVDSLDVEDPRALAALTAAQAFRENSKAFVNLSLYEQRLARQRKDALCQLQELQAQRKAAELAIQKPTPNANKTKADLTEDISGNPAPQFVFSTPEIEPERRLPNRRAEDGSPHAGADSMLEKAA
jgi:hypothetical protein